MSLFDERGFVLWGWLASVLTLTGQAAVIINEIHYDPDIKTQLVEFVELCNAGTHAVDLSGWSFSDGITYAFPSGTSLDPEAYLVVAQNPKAFQQKYGFSPFGPWQGNLSNSGERLVLRNSSGKIENEVDYQLGFPWPTVGDPPGRSIELIHPDLDNDLGGSWRSSPLPVPKTNMIVTLQNVTNFSLLMNESNVWRYDQSGSNLGTSWRTTLYDDSQWPSGPALLYASSANFPWPKLTPLTLKTPQSQTTFYFRSHFNCPTNPASLDGVMARLLLDDGAVFFLNGAEIYRVGMTTTGEVNYMTRATRNVGNATLESFLIPSNRLIEGDNVIAVEVHQNSGGGGGGWDRADILFGLRLDAYVFQGTVYVTNYVIATNYATPGARNSAFATNNPPQIRQVDHHPRRPRSGEPVTITAKITDPDGVATVTLEYQLVDPGNYIELTDPAYLANWTTLSMHTMASRATRWRAMLYTRLCCPRRFKPIAGSCDIASPLQIRRAWGCVCLIPMIRSLILPTSFTMACRPGQAPPSLG
jgi:hypothetical protein